MKTETQDVEGAVSIWAIPKTDYENTRDRKEDPKAPPYHLQLRTTTAWQDGSVNLHTEMVTITLPSDIDIVSAAIDTLTHAKDVRTKEYQNDINKLDEKIQSLLCITYQPDD